MTHDQLNTLDIHPVLYDPGTERMPEIIIDSKRDAKASAMMYFLAETSRANGLSPYKYFECLMEQLKEYPRNNVPENALEELMPWSESLPSECRKQNKKN